MKHYRYRCWGCGMRWGDYAAKPNREDGCPFCSSSLTTFGATDLFDGLTRAQVTRRMTALKAYEIDENGCWIWRREKTRYGYGRLMVSGRRTHAHRFFYEHLEGPIPEGLHIDHLCRNRACVNPTHMECVTLVENVLRGVSPHAENARKTHCIHGHELSGDNVRIEASGRRVCRVCAREKAAKYRQPQKDEMERMRLARNAERLAASSPTRKRKTHCKHGHEFTPENTHIDPAGSQQCRICIKARVDAYQARKKAA